MSSAAPDSLITGEAVLLDLRSASFFARILSFVIDAAIQLALVFGLTWGLTWLSEQVAIDDLLLSAMVLLGTLLVFVGYPVLTEVLSRGRSVGRLAVGTRVVRDDGGPVHARQALLRALMAMFELWGTSGAVALVTALIDRRSRRVGDLLAGTMVIQERLADRSPEPLEVPARLEDWAQSADIAALPPTLVAEIRGFLPRADQLAPELRRRRAVDLLQRTLPYTAPPPPWGTDPEAFLRGVLGERTRRERTRLARDARRAQELAAQIDREARLLPADAAAERAPRGVPARAQESMSTGRPSATR